MSKRKPIDRFASMRNMRIAKWSLVIGSAAWALQVVFFYQAVLAPDKDMNRQLFLLLTSVAVISNFLFNYFARSWAGAMIALPVHLRVVADPVEGWPCVWLSNLTGEITEIKVVFELLKSSEGTDVFAHSETVQIGAMFSEGRKKKLDEMRILIPEKLVEYGKYEGYKAMVTVNYVHQFTNFRAFRRHEIPKEQLQAAGPKPLLLTRPEEQL